MQEGETGSIPSLGRFHSCEAAKRVHHSYWACPIEPAATHAEPRSPSYEAQEARACAPPREAQESRPRSHTAREACTASKTQPK